MSRESHAASVRYEAHRLATPFLAYSVYLAVGEEAPALYYYWPVGLLIRVVKAADFSEYTLEALTAVCSCPGYTHHGYCKHSLGLARMQRDDLFPPYAEVADPSWRPLRSAATAAS